MPRKPLFGIALVGVVLYALVNGLPRDSKENHAAIVLTRQNGRPNPRVAILVNSDTNENGLGIDGERISADDIANGHLDRFDVLVVPGGSGRAKAESLGSKGCDEIRQFVSRGGGYIGICGGTYLATSGYEWSLGISPVKTLTGTLPGGGGTWPDRGVGEVSVKFTRAGRSFLDLKESVVPMRFSNGPIMTPINTDKNDARQEFTILATYKSELYRHVKQIGTMTGTPAIVSSRFGQGTVLLFSTHPEGSPSCSGVLSRSVWLVAYAGSSEPTRPFAIE